MTTAHAMRAAPAIAVPVSAALLVTNVRAVSSGSPIACLATIS